jgi:hypothetical protein
VQLSAFAAHFLTLSTPRDVILDVFVGCIGSTWCQRLKCKSGFQVSWSFSGLFALAIGIALKRETSADLLSLVGNEL